jgi:type II secretory pathway component HofQ
MEWKMQKTAILILLLFSAPVLCRQLSTVELKYRTADEIIPSIKPLLSNNEGISGRGFQLFIKANPSSLREIEKLVVQLDKQATQLIISVRNLNDTNSLQSNISINGRVSYSTSDTHNRITINTGQQSTASTHQRTPQIRVTEGKPALIGSGTSFPIKLSNRRRHNGSLSELEVTEYRTANSGFYVTAWLTGDQVKLEIQQQNQSALQHGAIDTSNVNTSVFGKLGQWIEIGNIGSSNNSIRQNIGARVSQTNTQRDVVYLKVEKAN